MKEILNVTKSPALFLRLNPTSKGRLKTKVFLFPYSQYEQTEEKRRKGRKIEENWLFLAISALVGTEDVSRKIVRYLVSIWLALSADTMD